jgi:phosphate transport system substrate-binding protein
VFGSGEEMKKRPMLPDMKKVFPIAVLALSVACGGGGGPVPPPDAAKAASSADGANKIQINGAGATFPYPIYSKWFAEYKKLHPNVEINYQPIGSGGGVQQMSKQTVFFGASDMPMTDEQIKNAAGPILHFPTVLGAVVPVFNVPGVTNLKFTGPLLADIYLGKIKKWNDPAIAAANAGTTLPPTDITVVHRSDGSGTSFIWVDFLAKLSPEWKAKVGVNTSVSWPVGVGGKGNEGVSGLVKQTPGSIGYVELIYAKQNSISYGSVKNQAGEFITADTASVTAAAAGALASMPKDFRVSITNAAGAGAYPISSFTWMLLYETPQDKALATIMVDFLKWALGDGQNFASDLGYAPLPPGVIQAEMDQLTRIKLQ